MTNEGEGMDRAVGYAEFLDLKTHLGGADA